MTGATAARVTPTRALLRDAGLIALVVFGLSFGLVGFRIEDVSGGLALLTRFDGVFFATALAFLGRIALTMLHERRALPVALVALPLALAVLLLQLFPGQIDPARTYPFRSEVVNWSLFAVALALGLRGVWLNWHHGGLLSNREARERTMDQVGARVQQAARFLGPALLGLAILLPFLPFADRRVLDIAILVVTYIMLGWGLNIVVGLAGLLDLGYVAFYAVGAYSYALLAQNFDLGFWTCLPLAGILAAFAGILLGFPVLRLRGDYLAIVTLGFGEIIRIILLNWYTFTGGPDGISGIPRPTFFGLELGKRASDGGETFHSFFNLTYAPIDRIIFMFYLILGLALLTNLFTLRIRKLPIGRAWEALREDETACRSLGMNPRNTKLTAFSIGAMFGGFGGSFFATRQGFISPESFTFIESAVILAIVVLGGMGSQIGVVFAAILLIGLPEFFRELQQYRMLAFGMAMVTIMVWRPSGLLAHREPTLRLHPDPDRKGAT
jgi:branched-chain amino acid transport system permease protein